MTATTRGDPAGICRTRAFSSAGRAPRSTEPPGSHPTVSSPHHPSGQRRRRTSARQSDLRARVGRQSDVAEERGGPARRRDVGPLRGGRSDRCGGGLSAPWMRSGRPCPTAGRSGKLKPRSRRPRGRHRLTPDSGSSHHRRSATDQRSRMRRHPTQTAATRGGIGSEPTRHGAAATDAMASVSVGTDRRAVPGPHLAKSGGQGTTPPFHRPRRRLLPRRDM